MKAKTLFLMMLAQLCCMTAMAVEAEIDGLWYELVSKAKEAKLIRYKETYYYGNIVIPPTVEYDGITYNVTSIGNNAFRDCTSLTSVTLPSSVTSIGGSAFYGCTGLTSVHISDLEAWCKNSFDFYSNPLYYAHHLYLNGEEVKDLVIPDGVTSIGSYAFSGCTGLTSVTIPEGVESIGNLAFNNCYGLTSLTLPSTVTSINMNPFRACSSLASIIVDSKNRFYDSRDNCNAIIEKTSKTLISGCMNTIIPSSVTKIGEDAFNNCTNLTHLTIPSSVIEIGNYAFWNCNSLTNITIPESVCIMGDGVFGWCQGLTTMTIPESVREIGRETFYKCQGLTSVIINDGVSYINASTFSGCTSLTSITIPPSVAYIGSHAFEGCVNLTSITIPEGVKTIGIAAFNGCTGLKSIIIPSTVIQIGTEAFYRTNITKVFSYAINVPEASLSDGWESWPGPYTIFNNENATLYVLASSIEKYSAAEGWSDFREIIAIEEQQPQCATPTISFTNGKIKFACETEDVEYVPTVTCTPSQTLTGDELELGTTYTVSVYAKREGYLDSEVATTTITLSTVGDVNGDGKLTIADVT